MSTETVLLEEVLVFGALCPSCVDGLEEDRLDDEAPYPPARVPHGLGGFDSRLRSALGVLIEGGPVKTDRVETVARKSLQTTAREIEDLSRSCGYSASWHGHELHTFVDELERLVAYARAQLSCIPDVEEVEEQEPVYAEDEPVKSAEEASHAA